MISILLNNKINMSELWRYSEEVVKAWDEASGDFKVACEEANSNTTISQYFEDGRLKEWYASVESIDGVGTKVQIYTSAFEWYIREFENEEISGDDLFTKSVDIWERMLHDLVAMNTDDLRQWEMAVSITNIIDINHLKWLRWKVFADSMAQALANVIRNNDIMLTAGETAILWDPKQTQRVIDAQTTTFDGITSLLSSQLWEDHEVIKQVFGILSQHQKAIEVILQEIEFNIGGTAKGVTDGKNKLSPLRPWQVVIALQEKSKDWIIWPRSNGITTIRTHMKKLGWGNWENLSYEDFLTSIWCKADSIPEEIHVVCRWKKMWEIATGKSTVFNPFVSRKLLWWVDGEKNVKLSSIIHITGNPGKKATEGAPWVQLDLDISEMPVPTIIAILQHTLDINSEDAMKGWNMGIPYILICDEDQAWEVIRLAEEDGIKARRIWITKEESEETISVIKWVWIDDSEVQLAT